MRGPPSASGLEHAHPRWRQRRPGQPARSAPASFRRAPLSAAIMRVAMYMNTAAVATVMKPSYGPKIAERYTEATTMSISIGTARKQIDSRMFEML